MTCPMWRAVEKADSPSQDNKHRTPSVDNASRFLESLGTPSDKNPAEPRCTLPSLLHTACEPVLFPRRAISPGAPPRSNRLRPRVPKVMERQRSGPIERVAELYLPHRVRGRRRPSRAQSMRRAQSCSLAPFFDQTLYRHPGDLLRFPSDLLKPFKNSFQFILLSGGWSDHSSKLAAARNSDAFSRSSAFYQLGEFLFGFK